MSLARDLGLRPHFKGDGRAKKSFADETEARTVAKASQETHGSNRRPYRAYVCPVCGAWHVGRKPARGKVAS